MVDAVLFLLVRQGGRAWFGPLLFFSASHLTLLVWTQSHFVFGSERERGREREIHPRAHWWAFLEAFCIWSVMGHVCVPEHLFLQYPLFVGMGGYSHALSRALWHLCLLLNSSATR